MSMKRRDILKGGLIATTVLTSSSGFGKTGADSRLFGLPNSAISADTRATRKRKLKLTMSRNDIPIKMWSRFEALFDFWERITNDPGNYKIIRQVATGKDGELDRFLKDSQFDTDEHRILIHLSDPDLLNLASEGDYESLLKELANRNILTLGNNLADDYENVIKQDEVLLKNLRREFSDKYSSLLTPYHDDDITDTVNAFNEKIILNDPSVNAFSAVAVFVAVVVAVTVAVAANVAVTANVVACSGCHGNFSENLKKDAMTLTLLAKKANNSLVAERAIIELRYREAAASLKAAEKLNLITIRDNDREEVYQNLYTIIRNSLQT